MPQISKSVIAASMVVFSAATFSAATAGSARAAHQEPAAADQAGYKCGEGITWYGKVYFNNCWPQNIRIRISRIWTNSGDTTDLGIRCVRGHTVHIVGQITPAYGWDVTRLPGPCVPR